MYGCNLACKYCYVGASRNHNNPVLPDLTVTRRILENLRAEGVCEVVLLGGEPTLHPRFADICGYLAELQFPHRGVVTNGTLVSAEVLKAIVQNDLWVDVTFRGADSAMFDAVASRTGAFGRAVDGIVQLARSNVNVGVEFDCTPQNHSQLFALIERLEHLGVSLKQVQLHRVLPAGDASFSPGDWILSVSQWETVFEQALHARRQFGVRVVLEDGFPFCLVNQKYWELILPCACGYSLITISPVGEARYCSCHDSSLGNILERPLRGIWEEGLRDYREPLRQHEACAECDLVDVCRGGCSASGWGEHAGRDIFESQFRPIKLGSKQSVSPSRIVAQQIVEV
jgi:radical SAM protein with 4Fe4S-binding SPASM domain